MKSELDIIRIDFIVSGRIELDLERVIEDPTWRTVTSEFQLPEELELALRSYLSFYTRSERFLREMPGTNGPGDINLVDMEVAFGQHNSSSTSNT